VVGGTEHTGLQYDKVITMALIRASGGYKLSHSNTTFPFITDDMKKNKKKRTTKKRKTKPKNYFDKILTFGWLKK